MRRVAAGIVLAASLLVAAPAVAADSYRDLVHRYMLHPIEAAAEFTLLTQVQVTDGVRGCLFIGRDGPQGLRCEQTELRAAAMLHADAFDVELGSGRRAEFALESALPILPEISDRTFRARWYAFVAGLYVANRDLQSATRVVNIGLQNQ